MKITCLTCGEIVEDTENHKCQCCSNPKFHRLDGEDMYSCNILKFWKTPILKSVSFVCENCGNIKELRVWTSGFLVEGEIE